MEKSKRYEAPVTEIMHIAVEANFATSGEKANIVTGYYWDDDEE